MPKSREHEPARIKEHLSQRGKEQITNVDNSRTDEKMVTTKPEAEKTEAPKKKKNIIRVYHAQNASDGGKNRPKRPASDKKPAARPQQKPQAVKPAEPVQQKPAAEAAPKKPQAAAPSETCWCATCRTSPITNWAKSSWKAAKSAAAVCWRLTGRMRLSNCSRAPRASTSPTARCASSAARWSLAYPRICSAACLMDWAGRLTMGRRSSRKNAWKNTRYVFGNHQYQVE